METERQPKKSHLGTPRFHKVFVTIWGLTYIMPRQHLPRFDKPSSLDTRLASGLCAGSDESTYVWYSLSGLQQRQMGQVSQPQQPPSKLQQNLMFSTILFFVSFGLIVLIDGVVSFPLVCPLLFLNCCPWSRDNITNGSGVETGVLTAAVD